MWHKVYSGPGVENAKFLPRVLLSILLYTELVGVRILYRFKRNHFVFLIPFNTAKTAVCSKSLNCVGRRHSRDKQRPCAKSGPLRLKSNKPHSAVTAVNLITNNILTENYPDRRGGRSRSMRKSSLNYHNVETTHTLYEPTSFLFLLYHNNYYYFLFLSLLFIRVVYARLVVDEITLLMWFLNGFYSPTLPQLSLNYVYVPTEANPEILVFCFPTRRNQKLNVAAPGWDGDTVSAQRTVPRRVCVADVTTDRARARRVN